MTSQTTRIIRYSTQGFKPQYQSEHLKNINRDSAWLLTRLENMGYSDYSNILLASCDTKEQITVYLKSVPLTNSKVLE